MPGDYAYAMNGDESSGKLCDLRIEPRGWNLQVGLSQCEPRSQVRHVSHRHPSRLPDWSGPPS